jgi:hypothetical protein
MRRHTRWVGIAVAGALSSFPALGEAQSEPRSWQVVPPTSFARTGTLTDRRLNEASGAAMSRANPGVVWTIADSGNPPELYAVDSTGKLLAVFPIAQERNTDWEAVAVGPCKLSLTCVYIADVGDNSERRDEVRLIRLEEPKVDDDPRRQGAVSATSLRIRYPDGPADVEAMGVDSSGNVLLISKGRTNGVRSYRIESESWDSPQPVTATLLGALPIDARSSNGSLVTGLALDPTGQKLVVRSYRTLFLFEATDEGLYQPAEWTACDILGGEPQGEGIAWLDDWRLLLTSEKGLFRHGTVAVVECRPSYSR